MKDIEIFSPDGRHVGIVDGVEGDAAELEADPASGGQHRLPMVASVGAETVLETTAGDAMARRTVAG